MQRGTDALTQEMGLDGRWRFCGESSRPRHRQDDSRFRATRGRADCKWSQSGRVGADENLRYSYLWL